MELKRNNWRHACGIPADDAQLNDCTVLAIHGAFVGLADATRLKGLVDAYTN